MKKNSLLLSLSFLYLTLVMLGCKTEEPAANNLQINPPEGIAEQVLESETSYIFSASGNYMFSQLVFSAEMIKNDGTRFKIATTDKQSFTVLYKHDTIPEELWSRGGKDNIHVKGIVSCYGKSINGVKDTAYYEFYIPYKPNKPKITLLDTTITAGSMNATIGYFADGAMSYRIHYTALGETSQYYLDVNNKDDVSSVLTNLNSNKKYSIYLTAYNSSGSINSDTIVVGKKPDSQMSMVLIKTGTNLKYQFKLGIEFVNNLTINSVGIYDLDGNLKMSISAGINESFSVASLPSAIYILKVDVANDKSYAKSFLK